MQYEKFGSSKLWFFYDADGYPSGVRYYNGSSTADYYFVCNWRGDVIKIFDSTGADVAEYLYDAWGNVVSVRSPNGTAITSSTHIANVNPLRYRGYYYDTETKLYYVNSRYYDPEVKRMLNADDSALAAVSLDTLTDKNYFAYCDNNPVIRTDSDGDYWHIVAGAAVGGIVNAVAQAIDQGGIHNAKDVAKIALSTITGAVGGALSASGLVSNALVAVTIDGALTAVTDLGISLIDNDFNFEKIDWFETISNVAVSASTSAIVGKVYNESTSNAVSTISKSMQKGKNKIKKGLSSPKTASKVKGTIKTGQKMILEGRKNLNKINMRGSMIGSIVSGIVSTVKKCIKSIFE